MTAERDLAEERLRAYRRELFGAKGEARDPDQLGLFNEAEALASNALPAQEDAPDMFVGLSRNHVLIDTYATLTRRALSLTSLHKWGHEGCSFLKDPARIIEQIEKHQLKAATETITRHYQHVVRYYHFEAQTPGTELSIAEALLPFVPRKAARD